MQRRSSAMRWSVRNFFIVLVLDSFFSCGLFWFFIFCCVWFSVVLFFVSMSIESIFDSNKVFFSMFSFCFSFFSYCKLGLFALTYIVWVVYECGDSGLVCLIAFFLIMHIRRFIVYIVVGYNHYYTLNIGRIFGLAMRSSSWRKWLR